MAGKTTEQLIIDLKVKQDQAKRDLAALDKQLDALTAKPAVVDVEANTKPATADVAEFAAKLDKLTAEDQVVLLSLKAAGIQSELSSIATDLATLDASDPSIDVKLERFGELSGDLDTVQSKIKAIGETPIEAGGLGGQIDGVSGKLRNMGADLERVRGEADQSRSVLANMVGNSTQDLGQLGGVAGTAGMALGQLAEYATEGGISLSGLAKVAGPMLLVAGAVYAVTSVLGEYKKAAEEAAKVKAFDRKNVDEYAKALAAGKDAVDDYTDSAKEAGKIEIAPNVDDLNDAVDLLGLMDGSLHDVGDRLRNLDIRVPHGIQDLTDEFEQAKIGAREFFEAAADPQGKGIAMQQKIIASGIAVKDQALLLAALTHQTQLFADGTEDATTRLAVFGTAVDQAAQASAILQAGIEANAATVEQQTRNDEAHQAAIDGVNEAIAEQVSQYEADAQAATDMQAAQEALIESAANAADSQRAANKAYEKFGEVIGDNKATSEQAADAAISFAKAQEKAKDDSAAASGQIRTNTEKVDSLNDSLLATAGASATGRAEIVAYIGQLNGIPPDKQTEILTLLNEGKFDEAKAKVDEFSTTKKVAVDADTSAFDSSVATSKASAAKPVTVVVKADTRLLHGPFAAGTSSVPEPGGIAGEAGAEFAELRGRTVLLDGPTFVPAGTRVTSAARTRRILARRSTSLPRFATGTGQSATIRTTPAAMSFTYEQNAPVYGVDDLDRHLAAWSQRIAQQISVGRRN